MAGEASAKWNSCSFSNYQTIYTSLAQGVGVDSTKTDTDCVEAANTLGQKTKVFRDSLSNIKADDWAAPLYNLAELSTDSTQVFTACQTTNLAKQFAVRMNSLGGLFDLGATIGVAFLKEFVTEKGSSDLYNSIKGFNDATTCADTALNRAKITKFTMSYEAQPIDF